MTDAPRKPGRKPLGERAMTATERSAARYQRARAAGGRIVPVPLNAAEVDELILARHLSNGRDDAQTLRNGLRLIIMTLGEYLTPEMRAKIIDAAKPQGEAT